jgi:hypothetical protein
MSCRRFYLRRKFVSYLEGVLSPQEAKRLEEHLLNCNWCRAKFVRLRSGHQLAQQLHRLKPDGARRLPEFETMTADSGEMVHGRRRWARAWESWFDALAIPRVVQGFMALVFVLLALLVVSNRRIFFNKGNSVTFTPSVLDFGDFHHLGIEELKSNTKPHVAIEGYVRDVYSDTEEGTLHFKLVKLLQASDSYIVCEILYPIKIPVPNKGSHVRIYGVARFDAQTDRMWYEVNPVLKITVLEQ